MPGRRNIASESPWETRVGYSRAVRAGNFVFVSGTTAEGRDAFEQATAAIARIESALRDAGASLGDVVRTRIFVRNIDDWERIADAHVAAFGDVKPAATMVEVSRFIAPSLLVEIEADAYVCAGPPEQE